MKFKCEQCGTLFEDKESCPLCGAEPERSTLPKLDRDAFWQEVKYSHAKTESDK